MIEMHLWRPARFIVLLTSIAVGCGDGAPIGATPPGRCHDDQECQTGATCQLTSTPQLSSLTPNVESIALPIPAGDSGVCLPCIDSDCPMGEACGGVGRCPVCVAGCKHADCNSGSVCEQGVCTAVPSCDAVGFPGCAEDWICDPDAVNAPVPETYAPTRSDTTNSSTLSLLMEVYESTVRDIAAGCRPVRCDEPMGPSCPQYSVCDPTNADPTTGPADARAAGAIGCRMLGCQEEGAADCPVYYRCNETTTTCDPVPCTELGVCPDTNRVCRAATELEAPDLHGCVWRTCQDGPACAAGSVCEPNAPLTDLRGCRPARCDEGAACPATWQCQPELGGSTGCVPPPPECIQGSECAAPQVCIQRHCQTELGTCR